MATRTEQKAKAREARLERERAEAAAARRRKRLYQFGAAMVAVIAIVAVVIAVASSGGSSSSSSSSSGTSASVNQLLAGIPQNGKTLGNPKAPVTVTLYEDLECPICKDFNVGTLHQFIAKDVRQGKAKLVFRSLQTATGDPTTFQFQQQAAEAAGRQNKLWHFAEVFYNEQGPEGTPYVTESYIDKIAKQIPGLNYNAWVAARKAPNISAPVSADEAQAQSKGFNSTPTIVVQGPSASPSPVAGALSYQQLQQMVKKAGG